MRRTLAAALMLALLAGCRAPPPQVELLIPVNARCTTCDDFIRCDGGSDNAAVYDPSFDLYRLKPKGTLAQLATIWEFLIQLFHTRTEDFRPLAVYARTTVSGGEARTDLVAHRIQLPEGWIDQVTGEWHDSGDRLRGSCRLLRPAEARELLRLFE